MHVYELDEVYVNITKYKTTTWNYRSVNFPRLKFVRLHHMHVNVVILWTMYWNAGAMYDLTQNRKLTLEFWQNCMLCMQYHPKDVYMHQL